MLDVIALEGRSLDALAVAPRAIAAVVGASTPGTDMLYGLTWGLLP